MPKATGLYRMVTYHEGLSPKKAHGSWSCEITWHNKSITSPLTQCLSILNLVGRWFIVTINHLKVKRQFVKTAPPLSQDLCSLSLAGCRLQKGASASKPLSRHQVLAFILTKSSHEVLQRRRYTLFFLLGVRFTVFELIFSCIHDLLTI